MILARFRDLRELKAACHRMKDAGCSVEMFSPHEPDESGPDAEQSIVPLFILLGGLLGAGGFFLLQTYADVWAYPMNIGGRPNFSWPAYVPNVWEIGVLCAVGAGLLGFIVAAGLPRLYHPVDRFPAFAEASRDGYFLLVDSDHPDRDRSLLDTLQPIRLQEMAS